MQGLKFAGIPKAFQAILEDHFKDFENGVEERFKEFKDDKNLYIGKVTFREWAKLHKGVFEA